MINLIRGQTKKLTIKIRGEISGDPHNFTGATEIVASFPQGSGNPTLDKKLSLAQITYPVSPLLGVLAMTIAASESPGISSGQGQLVRVVETASDGSINIFEGNILNVSD